MIKPPKEEITASKLNRLKPLPSSAHHMRPLSYSELAMLLESRSLLDLVGSIKLHCVVNAPGQMDKWVQTDFSIDDLLEVPEYIATFGKSAEITIDNYYRVSLVDFKEAMISKVNKKAVAFSPTAAEAQDGNKPVVIIDSCAELEYNNSSKSSPYTTKQRANPCTKEQVTQLFEGATVAQIVERSRFLTLQECPRGHDYVLEVLFWYYPMFNDPHFIIPRLTDSVILFDKQHHIKLEDYMEWIKNKAKEEGVTPGNAFPPRTFILPR